MVESAFRARRRQGEISGNRGAETVLGAAPLRASRDDVWSGRLPEAQDGFWKVTVAAHALDDSNFSGWYSHIRSTFAMADEAGMVMYEWYWSDDTEPKLGTATLKLFRDSDFSDI